MTRSKGDPRLKVLSALTPIEREVSRCNKCKIALTRTHTVFGKGNPLAELVVLGEGPGADEDKDGLPFRGKAGKLLHRGLEAIGHDETNTYFCNVLKCRACDITDSGWARNRTPDSEEISNCSQFLYRQLDVLPNKKVILAVGSTAMHWLLGADVGTIRIGTVRGKFLTTHFSEVVGVATYHPSYLLREENAEQKASVYEDFKLARDYLAGKYGSFEDLDLKSKHDFDYRDGGWDQKSLPRSKRAEEERHLAHQRTGRLLDSQRDRYTTDIEIWGEGGSVTVEQARNSQPVQKLVFGVKPGKTTKKKKEAALIEDEPAQASDSYDDDVPF